MTVHSHITAHVLLCSQALVGIPIVMHLLASLVSSESYDWQWRTGRATFYGTDVYSIHSGNACIPTVCQLPPGLQVGCNFHSIWSSHPSASSFAMQANCHTHGLVFELRYKGLGTWNLKERGTQDVCWQAGLQATICQDCFPLFPIRSHENGGLTL